MRYRVGFTWLLIAVMMASCGFHLRGIGPEGLPPIYIDGGNSRTGIRLELEHILRGSGGQLVAVRDQARVILRLTQEDYQRWPLSISRQLSVQEYELIYTVAFQITDIAGKALSSLQTLSFTRDYSFSDTTQVLGKGNEEALLRQEMIYDASRQILAQVLTILERQEKSTSPH
ncbi:LPS-assembly lipoprotein [Gammaproteobacteria bacterium]